MTFEEIVSGLGEKFAVEGLAAENGEAALEIDGMPVLLAEAGGAVLVTGLLGDAPPEGGEAFANLLLEANAGLFDAKAMAFARNGESKAYLLVERIPSDGADLDAFCTALGEFADTLETWRKLLGDFRPAAEAAAAASGESPSPMNFAMGNFMQV